MKWKCEKCGACCEILFPIFFGAECREYDKEKRLCKIYDKRPDMCRVKHQFGEEATIKLCQLLRQIRERK
jgi:Fe-S-cluster containining protein